MIDFVMHKDDCTKHEAIERCKAMAGGEVSAAVAPTVTPKPMTGLPPLGGATEVLHVLRQRRKHDGRRPALP